MNWKLMLQNWKSTAVGIVVFILGIQGVLSALISWANNQPVNWKMVVVDVALAVAGVGHSLTKDADVHSTTAQVQASTQAQVADVAVAKAEEPPKGKDSKAA